MSSDLQLAHACPHIIRFERITITDGITIYPKSPISGQSLISLTLNDIPIPPLGLFTEAKITFPQANQYRFPSTAYNTLSIASSSFPTLNITFPTNPFSRNDLLNYLNAKLPTALVAVADGNSVALTDKGLGVSYTLEGTAMPRLGFSSNKRVVKAKQLVPGWGLAKRDEAGTRFNIEFLSPVPSNFTQGIIDYQTKKQFCIRCNSTGVENDIRFDASGDISKVRGYDLLYQSVAKICLTEVGSNPYHLWYGSKSQSLIGNKSVGNTLMALREAVYKALKNLQEVQRQQALAQVVTPEERLAQVVSVETSYIGDDVTSVMVDIVVRSQSYNQVNITIVFAVPGSIPLDGSLS